MMSRLLRRLWPRRRALPWDRGDVNIVAQVEEAARIVMESTGLTPTVKLPSYLMAGQDLFVLMANDYPKGIFTSLRAAQWAIEREYLRAQPIGSVGDSWQTESKFGNAVIYLRLYPFKVNAAI